VQFKDDDVNGSFSSITQHVTLEMDPLPPGTPSTRTFIDDWSLTGGTPPGGSRFFRVQTVK
jgi:hypothetical protein